MWPKVLKYKLHNLSHPITPFFNLVWYRIWIKKSGKNPSGPCIDIWSITNVENRLLLFRSYGYCLVVRAVCRPQIKRLCIVRRDLKNVNWQLKGPFLGANVQKILTALITAKAVQACIIISLLWNMSADSDFVRPIWELGLIGLPRCFLYLYCSTSLFGLDDNRANWS